MKQAVVLIHGIGEQKPMETLRRFVAAVLPPAAAGQEQYWSKPDPMSGSFELRRLQTPGRTKTHFYEFYWAYHVEGTKLSHLWHWFSDLLFRRWRDIPPALRSLWVVSWVLVGAFAGLVACGGLSYLQGWYASQPQYGPFWLAALLATAGLQGVLINYVGDAARYLSPHPRNIALRQKIRAEGVRLLKELHGSRDYDRVIIVGHSLGSVIGYDIITKLWIDYNTGYDFKKHSSAIESLLAAGESPQPVIRNELAKAAENLSPAGAPKTLDHFRETQLQGWKEQRQWGNPWRVTDFITLGSPLAHSALLLARDREEFEERKRQRELPTCPPVKDSKGFAYGGSVIQTKGGRKFSPLVLHHAAPFAVTRWTNIFFPARFGLFGDIIGGPLQPVFGPGIKDIPVSLNSAKRFTPAAHKAYWKVEAASPAKKPKPDAEAPPLEPKPNELALDVLKRVLELDRIRRFNIKRNKK